MDSHHDHSRSFAPPSGRLPADDARNAHLDRHGSSPESFEVAPRVGAGLQFLLQAKQYAEDVAADLWDFALELRELRSLDLTNSDLRWLALKGYVDYAREITEPGDEKRMFRRMRGLTFVKRLCFVVTDEGCAAATTHDFHTAAITARIDAAHAEPLPPKVVVPPPRLAPHWDSDLQELRLNGLIVKQFKVPAPNQEMVLAAFEEENWPARIDDPLPPQADQDPKRRLHDTIVSLNRNHKHRLIRFMGDGSGEGVRWTVVTDEANAAPDADA